MILRYYRREPASREGQQAQQEADRLNLDVSVTGHETCFYVEVDGQLSPEQLVKLKWLLTELTDPDGLTSESRLVNFSDDSALHVVEIGPNLRFETPFSSTTVTICQRCGLFNITRVEQSRRLAITANEPMSKEDIVAQLVPNLLDRMTEQYYPEPLTNLTSHEAPAPMQIIPLLEEGVSALVKVNSELGLGMDEADFAFYHDLFLNKEQRNPTEVELFQLGQANSEHCRHHFFKGMIVVDSQVRPFTLMDLIKRPWQHHPGNSLIAFADDASAISVPWEVAVLLPAQPGSVSPLVVVRRRQHPTCTAETHNFPSGISPYEGCLTLTGGRIRDTESVGRGGYMQVGGTGYFVGNLHLPGWEQPWETTDLPHPNTLASPLDILVKGSQGAYDYGNCIGEPVIYGFFRTAGIWVGPEYRAHFKPVMYGVGVGQIDQDHLRKETPEPGWLVVQLGGPAYPIGLGGGSASSMLQGENRVELDFNAVQRGDAEMGQRVVRVIRACQELGSENPILVIHDLGAGGDATAITEICDPIGGLINIRAVPSGDHTMTMLVWWGNEAQEREAILVDRRGLATVERIAERECCPLAVIGEISGDGRLIIHDSDNPDDPDLVNLSLADILGSLPQKTFSSGWWEPGSQPLSLPADLTVANALDRVLRLPAVASKRFLTVKVDRSVSGLVTQQQGVGPYQLPLSDYGVVAQSYHSPTGTAMSLGERPMIGLISPEAMARLAVAEALFNLVGVVISDLADLRFQANWMLAAKQDNEADWLYRATKALVGMMEEDLAIDGGKDSLTMATKTVDQNGQPVIVKGPNELVLAAYAPVPDVTCKVSCVLPTDNDLLLIDLSAGYCRLGGSALAQVYSQVGTDCPDLPFPGQLMATFRSVQSLIKQGLVNAIHDRSDGGLITTLLEMAFAGGVGLQLTLTNFERDAIPFLFAEEVGLVIACSPKNTATVTNQLEAGGLTVTPLGRSIADDRVTIVFNRQVVLQATLSCLRQKWDEVSQHLELLQANPDCVRQESKWMEVIKPPRQWQLTFKPQAPVHRAYKPQLAVLREEGSNGDREMAAAFEHVGFEVWDVMTGDLKRGDVSLDQFRGLAVCGGFSFRDALGSGKGWAASIRFDPRLVEEFNRFYYREETFSFGICNGCQMLALLGWPIFGPIDIDEQYWPHFTQNRSGRFESRFVNVKVLPSPAIMFQDMVDSVLGIWVDHGEGNLVFPRARELDLVRQNQLSPLCYTDPYGNRVGSGAASYPHNPNGSTNGLAGLCSPDGRHFIGMPHPERLFQRRQWPDWPAEWQDLEISPWLKPFQNAYEWCMQ